MIYNNWHELPNHYWSHAFTAVQVNELLLLARRYPKFHKKDPTDAGGKYTSRKLAVSETSLADSHIDDLLKQLPSLIEKTKSTKKGKIALQIFLMRYKKAWTLDDLGRKFG